MGLVVSMTGYGRGEARSARSALTVEVRSLNHRFLETSLKLPRALTAHEPEVRRLVQGRVARGRVDLAVTVRRIAGAAPTLRTDVALAGEYARAARTVAEATGLPAGLSVAEVLRLPGVVSVEEATADEEEDGESALLLKTAAAAALDDLVRMRQTEGTALARDLAAHLDALGAWVGETGRALPAALARIQARLRERVQALLGEAPPPDPGRLAQEVAMLAARTDVAEELARLASHLEQFRALLRAGGAVGRQLDFLAQELHREVNTIASKVDDAELVARVLEARTVIERIREQVQNVE
jgi:uncharacterized protein (TIGR00255 family)